MKFPVGFPSSRQRFICVFCAFFFLAHLSGQELLLEEGFEAPDALSAWTVHAGAEGRIEIIDEGDGRRLRMDDSVDNSVFSRNSISRTVDISGLSQINLGFDFNRLNDEWHRGTEAFDGVSITVDGNLVERLSAEHFVIGRNEFDLDAYLGPDVSTLELGFHQYDNMGAPYDGLEWDDIKLSARRTREIYLEPRYQISEGDDRLDVLVVLDPVPEDDVALSLRSPSHEVISQVVFPKGQSMATLQFPVDFDNSTLSGNQSINLDVSDGYFHSETFMLTVVDDETAGLEVDAPETIMEDQSASILVFARNLNRYQNISVQLESSHPEIISVPSSIAVNASYYSDGGVGSFTVSPVYDPSITGDQEVTITARYGNEEFAAAVSVVDVNTLNPIIGLEGGPLVEGVEAAEFMVYFNADLDEAAEVALSVDDPSVTLSLDRITILPENGTGRFSLSIADDEATQGSRPFNLTATAVFTTGEYETTEPFTILDNDVAGFTCELADMARRGGSLNVAVRAVDADGNLLPGFEDTVSIDLEDSLSGESQNLATGLVFTGGALNAAVELPADAKGNALILQEADGTRHDLGQIILYGEIEFAANSLEYDDERGLFYAVSGGQALSGHLHSVTPINPATLAIGDGIFLGNSPTISAITSDNAYLYVGQHDSFAVSRLNLDTLNVDQVVTLKGGSSWTNYSFWPKQILPLPGEPTRIVVVQDATSSSYAAVHSYTNGVIDPDYAGHDEMSLVNGSAPDIFYGYNYSDTGYNFRKYQLTESGFELLEDKRGVIRGSRTRIYGENDRIFTNTGMVVDGVKMEQTSQISLNWSETGYPSYDAATAVAVDLERSRLYFAKDAELLVYEAQGFSLIRKLQVPVAGDIVEMERYGESGLAIATNAGEILFLESSILVPTGAPTDLEVAIEATPRPAALGESVTFSGVVRNTSDVDAIGVNLVLTFNDGIDVPEAVGNPDGGTRIIRWLGDMEPGATHEFTYSGTPSKLTTLVGYATATTLSLDENYADNQDSVLFNVGFESSPESVNVLELECNDALYDPSSGLVLVTTRATAHQGIANKVLGIDPMTGLVERSVALPGEGGAISLSDDGSVAYVLNGAHSLAYRIDWFSEVHTDTVAFPDLSVDDLEILAGTTDSIVVGSGWDGVRIYDNGVLRPDTSGTYNGDQVALLPDPDLIFAYNTEHTGFESFKFEITETGVQTLAENGGLFSGFYKTLKSDGYYVFDGSGLVVRADLMAVDGRIDTSFVGGVGAFEPERDRRRVYYASGQTVGAYDTQSYLFIRSIDFDALPTSLGTLERWGNDGFVSVLSNGFLAIIRSEIIPDEANAIDLSVDLQGGEIFTDNVITVTGSAFGGQGIERVSVNGVSASTGDAFANWNASIQLQAGENTVNVVADPFGAGAPRVMTFTVYQGDPARVQENLEAMQWFERATGQAVRMAELETSDYDQDGVNELTEYLFGADPSKPGQAMLEMEADEEGGLVFSFVHREVSSYTYTIMTSLDMKAWDATHSRVSILGDPEPLIDKPGYARSSFEVDDGGSGQCFIRIEAE
jgi:hypothetical protein